MALIMASLAVTDPPSPRLVLLELWRAVPTGPASQSLEGRSGAHRPGCRAPGELPALFRPDLNSTVLQPVSSAAGSHGTGL